MKRLGLWLLLLLIAPVPAQVIQPDPKADASEREQYRRALRIAEGTRISVDWKEAAHEDLWKELRGKTTLNFVFDREVRGKEFPPVTLTVTDVTVASVLALVAEMQGLAYQHRHGAVFITTPEALLAAAVHTRVYDIRDLLYIPPDFPPRRPIGLTPGKPEEPEPEPEQRSRNPDEIVDLIRSMTGSAMWENADVSLVADRSTLVVRHGPKGQAEVARALMLLRSAL